MTGLKAAYALESIEIVFLYLYNLRVCNLIRFRYIIFLQLSLTEAAVAIVACSLLLAGETSCLITMLEHPHLGTITVAAAATFLAVATAAAVVAAADVVTVAAR